MNPKKIGAAILLALSVGAPALAQEGEGIGPAPREARAVIARAVKALGGRKALEAVKAAALKIDPKGAQIRERHVFRLDGRLMHYSSRRKSGAGFDVVVGSGAAFLCDRSKAGKATYVEDLAPDDAREGAYERDVLFMPILLIQLLSKNARMDYRGRNSKGEEVVRARIDPPAGARHEKPFTVRLRFAKDTSLPVAVMGVVPLGQDKGKKRYCEYSDFAAVKLGPHKLLLPQTIKDQRGKDLPARTFKVRWQLNPQLPPTLFVRPQPTKD